MQMKTWGFLLVEELETTFQLNSTRFLDKRRLHWAFQAESTFFNKSRVFQEYGGINEDWMNEWVSHQGITAGWPSGLLWHKQKGHVPLLSAEGTPHTSSQSGPLLPPTDDLWSCFLELTFSGTTFFSHLSQWRCDITLTTYWTQQVCCYMVKPDHCDKSGEYQTFTCSAIVSAVQ